ncbi:hypothetical protein [Flavobacterium cheongpyeongense]|nr:hypothetical protein [Flavobacterium cheongpyeongense]
MKHKIGAIFDPFADTIQNVSSGVFYRKLSELTKNYNQKLVTPNAL